MDTPEQSSPPHSAQIALAVSSSLCIRVNVVHRICGVMSGLLSKLAGPPPQDEE